MFRSLLPAAVAASLILHTSAASAGTTKPGEVRVHARNVQLFSRSERGMVCYAKAANPQLAPGKIVKRTLRRRSSGRKVLRKYFVPLQNLINEQLTRFGRTHRSDRRRLERVKKKLQSRLAAQIGLCSGPIQAGGGGSGAASSATGGALSFGGTAPIGSFLRLRWFPSDHANRYFIYLVRADGVVLSKEAATPSGCTLLLTSGYTSGLCSYLVDSYRLPLGYTILISAANSSGESPVSRF